MTTQTVTIQVDQATAEVVRALITKAEMEGTSTAGLLTELRESGEPLLLAINGGEKVVVQEAGSYQKLLEDLDRAEAMAGIRRGLEAMKAGRSRPVRDFLAELRQEFGFPENQAGGAMSYRVEITEPAESDAREAVRWIAQYSTDKATVWFFDFLEAADSLQNFPARCSIAPESSETLELRHLLFGKYRIIFLIDDETVSILHVRHQKQKPLSPDEI